MLGLMRKDLCLLLQRSRALVVMAAVGVLIGFSTDGAFMMGYLTMISVILAVGTISYDEFDNGYPFLMTLPVTRKGYVMAKYAFCLFSALAGWAVATMICLLCGIAKGDGLLPELLGEAPAFLPVAALMIAVLLPLQLKYGAEKSRLALAILCGGIVALMFVGRSLLPGLSALPDTLSGISDAASGAALVGISAAALAISCCVSLGIMEKKEF